MRNDSPADGADSYDVKARLPAALSKAERAACIAITQQGAAVDPESANENLPLASMLAVATTRGEIVGVGAIKRVRMRYAARIARSSGFGFAPETPELGYVAVDLNHQRRGLSHRIVTELVANHPGPLFATTDKDAMKKTLAAAGFVKSGEDWEGNSGTLSLWLKA